MIDKEQIMAQNQRLESRICELGVRLKTDRELIRQLKRKLFENKKLLLRYGGEDE